MAKKLTTGRIKQIRARFQRAKPTPEQLIASGEMEALVSQTAYVAGWQAVEALKKARRQAGLSLSQVAARGGLDKATLSRLEASTSTRPSTPSAATLLPLTVAWPYHSRRWRQLASAAARLHVIPVETASS